jgi:WD40 repeat protein
VTSVGSAMDVAELTKYCRRDIARSIQYSSLLPSLCRLTLLINYIPVGVSALAAVFTLNLGLGSLSIATYRLLKWLHKSPLLAPLPSERFRALPDITDDLEASDRDFLRRLMIRAGREANDIRVLSNLGSPANTPSVSWANGVDYVILPPGFFTVWQMSPSAAEAMLAHEVGHLLQRDADLYIEFSRYMRFMLSRYLPVLLLLAIGGSVGTAILVPEVTSEAQLSSFEAITGLTYFRNAEAYSTWATGIVFSAYAATLCLLATAALACALALIYRILKFRSESVCDRISLALTENAGIRDALNLFGSEDSRQFFAPSLAWRRAKVSTLWSSMEWSGPSGEDTNGVQASATNIFKPQPNDFRAKPQRRIWLLLRMAVWVAAVWISGAWVHNYLRTHPFGWSKPEYHSDHWPWGRGTPAAMSDDGSTLALLNRWTQSVQVRDVRTGAVRGSFPAKGPFQKLVRLNGTGGLLIVVPSYERGRLYDVNAQTYLGELPDQYLEELEVVRIDGQEHLLSATENGAVTLWQLLIEGGKSRLEARAKFKMAGRFAGLGVRADGGEFVTASDLTEDIDSPSHVIEVWDTKQGIIRVRFRTSLSHTNRVSLSSDGRWVAFNALGRVVVAKLGASIELHDLYNFRSMIANPDGNVAFAPNANVLVSEYDVSRMDWSLALYGPPTSGEDASAEWPKKQLSKRLSAADVRWSSDGRVLFAASYSGSVTLLSMPQGTLIDQFEPDALQSLIVSSDLRYAVTLHSGNLLRVWNLQEKDNETRTPLREYHFSGIKCAGVLEGQDDILVRHEVGASGIALPEGDPKSLDDPGDCSLRLNPQYVFNEKSLVDSKMQWTIPLSEALTEPTVLSGPERGDVWHPDYRILHRSGDGVSFLSISSSTGKDTMAAQAAIAAGLFIALMEAALLLWRRYRSPF